MRIPVRWNATKKFDWDQKFSPQRNVNPDRKRREWSRNQTAGHAINLRGA